MYRIARFMQGRYGVDKLFYAIVIADAVASFVNIFLRSAALQIIIYAVLILALLRMFSRNIAKRSEENRKFCRVYDKILGKFRLLKRMWRERKTHSYVKCSECKKILRLPKQKGVHTVTCPNCKNIFQVKI